MRDSRTRRLGPGIGLLLAAACLTVARPAAGAADLRVGVRREEAALALRSGQVTALVAADGSRLDPPPLEGPWAVELAAYRGTVAECFSPWLARAVASALARTGCQAATVREGGQWVVVSPPPHPQPEPVAEGVRALATAGFAARVDLGRYPAGDAPGFRLVTAAGPGATLLSSLEASGAELEGRAYRGRLEVGRSPGTGLLQAVNRVGLEEYLRGVVAHEMPAAWPSEALKAQAVAARTYALANRGRHGGEGFDLCATVHCQVYGGLGAEHARTDQAVAATAGLTLTYRGSPINAVFHAHAGGRTDSSEEIWGWAAPYLRGVAPTFEQPSPWRLFVSRRELEARLDSRLRRLGGELAEGAGAIHGLNPTARTAAGRVRELEVRATRGTARIAGDVLREALGTGAFRSTLFEAVPLRQTGFAGTATVSYARWPGAADPVLELVSLPVGGATDPVPFGLVFGLARPAGFFFLGDGFGHGVGMSQWGAREMAAAGGSFRAILTHFYPGADLTAFR